MQKFNKQEKFSIRKYNIGAFSVAVGATLLFGTQLASADEVTAGDKAAATATTEANPVEDSTRLSAPATEDRAAKDVQTSYERNFDDVKTVDTNGQAQIVEGNAKSNWYKGTIEEINNQPGAGGSNSMNGEQINTDTTFVNEKTVTDNMSVDKQVQADGTVNWKITYLPTGKVNIYGKDGSVMQTVDQEPSGTFVLALTNDNRFAAGTKFTVQVNGKSYEGTVNDNGAIDFSGMNIPELRGGKPCNKDGWQLMMTAVQNSNKMEQETQGAMRKIVIFDKAGNEITKDGWFQYDPNSMAKLGPNHDADKSLYNRIDFERHDNIVFIQRNANANVSVTVSFTTKLSDQQVDNDTGKEEHAGAQMKPANPGALSDGLLAGYSTDSSGYGVEIAMLNASLRDVTEKSDKVYVTVKEQIESTQDNILATLPARNITINQAANEDLVSNAINQKFELGAEKVATGQVLGHDYTVLEVVKGNHYPTTEQLAEGITLDAAQVPGWTTKLTKTVDAKTNNVIFTITYVEQARPMQAPEVQQDGSNINLSKIDPQSDLVKLTDDKGNVIAAFKPNKTIDKKTGEVTFNGFTQVDPTDPSKEVAEPTFTISNVNTEDNDGSFTITPKTDALVNQLETAKGLKVTVQNDDNQTSGSAETVDSTGFVYNASNEKLQNLVNNQANLEKTPKYYNATEEEQKAYDAALKAANDYLAQDPASWTSEEMKNKQTALQAAYDALSGQATDTTDAKATLATVAEDEKTNKYLLADPEKKAAVDAARDAVNTLLANLDKNDVVTQKDLNEAVKTLKSAEAALNGEENLAAANKTLQELDGQLTAEQKTNYQNALNPSEANANAINWTKDNAQNSFPAYIEAMKADAKANMQKATADLNKDIEASNLNDDTKAALKTELADPKTNTLAAIDAIREKLNNDTKAISDANTDMAADTITKNLTPEELAGFNNELATGVQTPEQQAAVVEKAKKQAQTNLAKEQTDDTALVQGLDNLDDAAKKQYLDAINEATTIPEVKQKLAEAQAANKQLLTNAQQTKTTALADLKNLTPEETADFTKQIADAKNVAEVNAIYEAAKKADAKNLASEQETANTAINALENLPADQKTAFTDKVNAATTVADVKKILADANAADTTALTEDKQAKTTAIADLKNLTPEEAADFTNQVAAAKNIAEVAKIYEAAKAADAKNLASEQETTNTAINALENLPADQKTAFTEKVNAATTVEDVKKILADANAADKQALADDKQAKTTAIADLKNLTPEEAADFTKQVAAAKNIAEVAKIYEAAKAADAKNLASEQETANTAINALENLPADQKTAFTEKVNAATTVEDVKKILADAVAADKQALADDKQAKTTAIADLKNLTPEEATDFTKQVANAKNIAEVAKIYESAKAADAKNLANEQETANTAINALENLPTDQKTTFTDKVNAATTVEDVKKILADAIAADKQALADDKQAKTTAIADLKNLTPEEATDFAKQVADAKNIAEVAKIYEAAKAADAKNLAAAQKDANTTINALENLNADQKADFTNKVNAAKTIEEVNKIVADAQAADKKALADYKAEKTAALSDLNNLTFDDVKEFTEKIANAKNIAEVDEIFAEAKATHDAHLAEAQKAADKEIADVLNELSDDQKEAFTDDVNNATTVADVKQIIEKAKAVNVVDALANLNDDQMNKFNDAIKDAADSDAIQAIVEEAQKQDAANLAAAKDVANAAIDAMKYLSDEEKANYKAQVAEATTIEDVNDIVAVADENNDLNKHKLDINNAIDALTHLTDEQKAKFKAQVNDADSIEAIDAIYEEAKKLNNDNQAAEEAKKRSALLPETANDKSATTIAGLSALGLSFLVARKRNKKD